MRHLRTNRPAHGPDAHCKRGNPSVLVSRANGAVESFATSGLVLGMFDDAEWAVPWIVTARIGAGDSIVCLTDGVTDQRSLAREPFGLERVKCAVSRAGRSPLRSLRRWFEAFSRYARGEDDLTVLCVQPRSQAA